MESDNSNLVYTQKFDTPVGVKVGFTTNNDGYEVLFTQVKEIYYFINCLVKLVRTDNTVTMINKDHSYCEVYQSE